jgi:hypothetical protein
LTIAAMIRAIPTVQRLREKDDFVASVSVALLDWEQLDAATWWCECRWRDHDHKYRRRLAVADSQATFEFPGEDDAFEFLLKFGATAKSC